MTTTVTPATPTAFERAIADAKASGKYEPKRLERARRLCLDARTIIINPTKDTYIIAVTN